MSPEAFITLARVVKTQGRHGEVAVQVHSDVPERFSVGMKLSALGNVSQPRRAVVIESLWPHKDLLVLKFAGVDSISDAEKLVGAELQVPRQQRAALEEGWNYVSDLVGCSVIDHGHEIGILEDVRFGAGEAPLLIVADGAGKEFDVPFAGEYLEGVDVIGKQIRMILPEGMLEINAPMTTEEKKHQRDEGKRKSRR